MSRDPYAEVASHVFPGSKIEAMVRLTGGVSVDVHRLDLKFVDGRTTRRPTAPTRTNSASI